MTEFYPQKAPQKIWQQLKQQLRIYFNLVEIQELCFDLGIDYEDLGVGGTSKNEIVLNLLKYVARHNLKDVLIIELRHRRPNILWPERLPIISDVAHLENVFEPWFNHFQSLIDEKSKDFVGRNFVFTAIDQFLASEKSGYFEIIADPGFGKTALVAEYVRRYGIVAHFNIRAQGINTPKDFLQNTCSQLIEKYNLPYTLLPDNATHDGRFLLHLIDEVSPSLNADNPLVIAVDALDEVDMVDAPLGVNLLFLSQTLPDHVFWVLTRRRGTLPLSFHTSYRQFDLSKYYAENLQDVRNYIKQVFYKDERLLKWIQSQDNEINTDTFINKLSALSENNFMYLRYMLPEIAAGNYKNLSIDQLPIGLQGYYEDHWQRMGMRTKPIPQTKLRIIYTICEVQTSVSRGLIADFAGENEIIVQEVLDEWAQFLHKKVTTEDTRYSLYHASFQDFLRRKDIVQAAGIELKDIHQSIANNLWSELYG